MSSKGEEVERLMNEAFAPRVHEGVERGGAE